MSIKNVLESEIDQVRLVRITDLHQSHAKTESTHRYSPATVYISINFYFEEDQQPAHPDIQNKDKEAIQYRNTIKNKPV